MFSHHDNLRESIHKPKETQGLNYWYPQETNLNHHSLPNPTKPSQHPSNYVSSLVKSNLFNRPRLTMNFWEDEGTNCYQLDANGICVARRQDNDMINGTKLLNVTGMSRGKRDGILKNEIGRVVIKIGAMHLKGVWITFERAKLLAKQFNIQNIVYPIFVHDPNLFMSQSIVDHSIPKMNHSLHSKVKKHHTPYQPYPNPKYQPYPSPKYAVPNHNTFDSLNFNSQMITNNDLNHPKERSTLNQKRIKLDQDQYLW